MDLGNLPRLSTAISRSLSAENPDGASGRGGRASRGTGQEAARDLGPGWKVSPAVPIEPRQTRALAEIEGPGAIQHIWMGLNGIAALAVLRIAWDGHPEPAVECPLGHFFACGWGGVEQISSLAVCMNPRNGFNCYWEMPFRSSCRMSVENIAAEPVVLYYQIDYQLASVREDAGCFHAAYRRSPRGEAGAVHAVLDLAEGEGHYVGTYLAWEPFIGGAPQEPQIAFAVDGGQTPSRSMDMGSYFGFYGDRQPFGTPYCGLARGTGPEGARAPAERFGLYRWHIMDPIRFHSSLRATIRERQPDDAADGCSRPFLDDLASVAYWYQE